MPRYDKKQSPSKHVGSPVATEPYNSLMGTFTSYVSRVIRWFGRKQREEEEQQQHQEANEELSPQTTAYNTNTNGSNNNNYFEEQCEQQLSTVPSLPISQEIHFEVNLSSTFFQQQPDANLDENGGGCGGRVNHTTAAATINTRSATTLTTKYETNHTFTNFFNVIEQSPGSTLQNKFTSPSNVENGGMANNFIMTQTNGYHASSSSPNSLTIQEFSDHQPQLKSPIPIRRGPEDTIGVVKMFLGNKRHSTGENGSDMKRVPYSGMGMPYKNSSFSIYGQHNVGKTSSPEQHDLMQEEEEMSHEHQHIYPSLTPSSRTTSFRTPIHTPASKRSSLSMRKSTPHPLAQQERRKIKTPTPRKTPTSASSTPSSVTSQSADESFGPSSYSETAKRILETLDQLSSPLVDVRKQRLSQQSLAVKINQTKSLISSLKKAKEMREEEQKKVEKRKRRVSQELNEEELPPQESLRGTTTTPLKKRKTYPPQPSFESPAPVEDTFNQPSRASGKSKKAPTKSTTPYGGKNANDQVAQEELEQEQKLKEMKEKEAELSQARPLIEKSTKISFDTEEPSTVAAFTFQPPATSEVTIQQPPPEPVKFSFGFSASVPEKKHEEPIEEQEEEDDFSEPEPIGSDDEDLLGLTEPSKPAPQVDLSIFAPVSKDLSREQPESTDKTQKQSEEKKKEEPTTATATTTDATVGFSFSAPATSGGFSFGASTSEPFSFSFSPNEPTKTTTQPEESSTEAPFSGGFSFGETKFETQQTDKKPEKKQEQTTSVAEEESPKEESSNTAGGFGLSSFSVSSAAAPSFSFGAPFGATEDNNEKEEQRNEKASSAGFSFGTTSSASDGGFSFGVTSSTTDAATTDSSSFFTFGQTSSESTKSTSDDSTTGGFKFGGESAPSSGFSFGVKFGNESTEEKKEEPKETPSFSFGAVTSTTDEAPTTGGFTFGGASSLGFTPVEQPKDTNAPVSTSSPSGGFVFNSPAASNSTFGGFSFGSTSSEEKQTNGTTITSSSPVLGFSASTTTESTPAAPITFSFSTPASTEDNVAEKKTEQQANPFAAAATSSADKTSNPFGSSSSFTFGSSNSTDTFVFQGSDSTAKSPVAPAFSFGGAAGATSSPVFGASSSSTPTFGQPASSPVFGASSSTTPTFGQSSSTPTFGQPASSPVFGTSSSGTPTFGQPATAAHNQFTFGATTAPSSGFTFGGTTTTSSSDTMGMDEEASASGPTSGAFGGATFNFGSTNSFSTGSQTPSGTGFSFAQNANPFAAGGGFAQNANPFAAAGNNTFGGGLPGGVGQPAEANFLSPQEAQQQGRVIKKFRPRKKKH